MIEIAGRTAFITGGANGIGLGIARSLAAAGARLALVDVDRAALERAKAELDVITPVAIAELDVRDRQTYERVADEVEAAVGPVSLLINNAGVASGGPTAKLTYELWDWVIGVNLFGVVNGVQTFLPRMLARGAGGHIVNTASGAGLVGGAGNAMYCTSKFGVVGLSESLRDELSEAGIGVSVLCPGPVATGIIPRSIESRPAVPESDEDRRRNSERVARVSRLLEQGVSVDAVGEMVLSAVRSNRLYVHTDRSMAEAIAQRGKAILDAVPAGLR